MTIEEKAKAYDKALEVAKRKLCFDKAGLEDSYTPNDLYEIFPELKESEDEEVRKALIDYFDDANKADENPLQSYGIYTDKAIAWLEKQGEVKESLISQRKNQTCKETDDSLTSEDEPENYKKQLMSEMTDLVKDYIKQKPKGITAWIARDKSGEVLLYEEEPVKLKNDPVWESLDGGSLGIKELPEGIDPRWEDEEPIEVELIIKKKTND